ncbi:hypothetical protein MMC28_007129 [Mycoblastus sanguinarius]|nr:hypothetical protein [Mycoblastus sanguinarius]
MDALKSFDHLNTNIPAWLSKLDNLTNQVAEQNQRFTNLSRAGEIRLAKKKHGSTESLRPKDFESNQVDQDTAIIASDTYIPPDPTHTCISHKSRPKTAANNAIVIQEIKRKRKPGSDDASGTPRYRTKNMIVVFYDSAIQDAFESLYRNIAAARNNLRKGKTDSSFKARMASLGMGQVPAPAADDFSKLNPKLIRSGFGRSRLGPDPVPKDKVSSFEKADQDLETAQNLCEVAAHQFLRDGDCRTEIEGMRTKFDDCFTLAKREVERLKEEEAREAKEQESSAEQPQVKEEDTPLAAYMQKKVQPPPLKQMNFTGTGAIEIDDGSDTESIHLDLSAFRRTARA